MKITKYHQSCLLIQTKGKRILIDPGNIGYEAKFFDNEWVNIDCVLVTHKHDDHCLSEVINEIVIRDNAKLYTTYEVVEAQSLYGANLIKCGDIIDLGDVKIGVTKAVHGYLPQMGLKNMVRDNVGYIIDDGDKKVYITSDSISFYNEYKVDIVCMPFNGNGLTFGEYDGTLFAKNTGAKLVIPIHMEHPNPVMMPDLEKIKKSIVEAGMDFEILDIGESLEV